MRLDKFIAKSTGFPRSKAKKLILSGEVTVDKLMVRSVGQIVKEQQSIVLSGESLSFAQPQYILLNKPKNYICSNKDEQYPSALNLLNDISRTKLHFAGRLDADTSGLVLISDDGQWTHRITSPRHQHSKTYIVTTSEKVSSEQKHKLTVGVILKDSDKATLPARVEVLAENTISLTITEGRYHQVKRMLAAVGNHVIGLHRQSIGRITIEDTMLSGEWRHLTKEEASWF